MTTLIKDILLMADQLNTNQRLRLLSFFVDTGIRTHEAADGTRINLSPLEPFRIDLIYTFVKQLHEEPIPTKYRL